MKFRQKLWALPLSACLVFGLGVSTSLYIATKLGQLRDHDNRMLEATLQVDRLSDQLDTALEGVSMGDSKKMAEAQTLASTIERWLVVAPAVLQKSFATYREEGFAVVQGMLAGNDMTSRIATRRAALNQWSADRKAGVDQAPQAGHAGFAALAAALRNTVIASALTTLATLLVLGAASWLIVRSVWRDLGGEPDDLCRVADASTSPRRRPGSTRSQAAPHSEARQSAVDPGLRRGDIKHRVGVEQHQVDVLVGLDRAHAGFSVEEARAVERGGLRDLQRREAGVRELAELLMQREAGGMTR